MISIRSKAKPTNPRDPVILSMKNEKELGYLYGMHRFDAQLPHLSDPANLEAYKEWLEENNKLEWFEQAELIEKYWLKMASKTPKKAATFLH